MREQLIKSVCGLCGTNCGILVRVKDGKLIEVKGDPEDHVNKGRLCSKGKESIEYLYNSQRLKYPLKRVGKKGEGKWERISWKEAFRITAKELNRVKEVHGPDSVFMVHGYSKDFMHTHMVKLANVFGTPNVVSPDNVCYMSVMLAHEYTLGFFPGEELEDSQCAVLWGINKFKTRFTDLFELKKGKSKGMKTIVIDPFRTGHAKQSDIWLQIKPGTDLALGLGMIKVIIDEELYDKEFVQNWSVGFKELKEHVDKYTPEMVSRITWIPEESIVKAARLYASSESAVICCGNALDHNEDSFHKARVVSILMALTGNIDIPGGQSEKIHKSMVKGRWPYDKELINMLSPQKRKNKVGIETGILPKFYYTSGQAVVKGILEEEPYGIKAGFIQASNPLSCWANANRTYEAFEKLDFLAVSEHFMTPTAALADIVFPAATHFEFDGIRQSLSGDVLFQRKVESIGECRGDHEILNGLADALGLGKVFCESTEEFWDEVLRPSGISFEEFKEKGKISFDESPKEYHKYKKHGFNTPSGKVEFYSERLKELGIDPLPTYAENTEEQYGDCETTEEYPFICTTYKSMKYLHSSGRHIRSVRKSHPHPLIVIHPKTAGQLGLKEGDWAYIETKQGKIKQKVQLDTGVDERVVIPETGWWFPEKGIEELYGMRESNYNILTSDKSNLCKEVGAFNIRGIACKVYPV